MIKISLQAVKKATIFFYRCEKILRFYNCTIRNEVAIPFHANQDSDT